ncbi:MAG: sugar ABC transporter ATP-binding protein, partial [Lachnospiraceae bacterium]|nr:sugar ABC transporter ATP-binding protein [Lachnospiraceae bacterium]
YTKDSGTVIVDGEEVTYKTPQEAEKAGIVFIYQEINALFDLTVEENMFMGKEITKKFGVCDKKAMREKAKEVMDKVGVSIPVDAVMSDLSVGQQQMIEICKALMVDAKVIIMDEPTAALTESETEGLFKVINQLREKGVSIVYISHRMEEIFALCDRITILRDGQYIDTKEIKDLTMDDVVQMMIGREIGERFPSRDSKIGDVVLKVEGLTSGKLFHDVDFEVRAGEVLGVAGLMGAGRTEIMQAIFGNLKKDSGKIYINGEEVTIKNPRHAIKAGIGFVTEDRKTEGLLLEKSIAENIEIANLGKVSKGGVLKKEKQDEIVKKGIDEFRVKCFGPWHECNNLSGGNQQKVVLAKWVYTDPKILILDEPTRGVDIGAKKEIYDVINDLAAKGVAVIMVSSELPEVLGMSDRIMVIREGEVRGIIDGKKADQAKIMTLATGGSL